VPLPVETADAWLLPDQQLQLSVWVDHSVVEVFGMGGLARVASRVYPDDDEVAWGVSSWVKLPSQLPVLIQWKKQGAGSSSSSDYGVVSEGAAVGASGRSSVRSSVRHGGFWSGLYCWWCKLWYKQCSCQCEEAGTADPRCTTSSSSSSSSRVKEMQQQQGSIADAEVSWVATADAAAWEVQNAWLPPSC
jgi:hypothetical protein